MVASSVRQIRATLVLLVATASFIPVVGAHAASPPPPPVQSGPVVSPAVHQDVSPPLWDIVEVKKEEGKHESHKPKPFHPANSGASSTSGTPSATTATAVPAT